MPKDGVAVAFLFVWAVIRLVQRYARIIIDHFRTNLDVYDDHFWRVVWEFLMWSCDVVVISYLIMMAYRWLVLYLGGTLPA